MAAVDRVETPAGTAVTSVDRADTVSTAADRPDTHPLKPKEEVPPVGSADRGADMHPPKMKEGVPPVEFVGKVYRADIAIVAH